MSNDFYKFSGLIGFILAWFGMLFVIHTQGRDKTKSISMHAANSKKSFLLLAFLSPLSMSLFMVFVVKWVAPKHHMSQAFVILNIIALTGYIVAGWAPAIEGIKGRIHDFFAYGASLLLIPISLMIATSSSFATLPRLMNAMTFVLMLSILAVMYASKREQSRFLYLQIAYFLTFDISLLAAGYIR